MRPTPPEAPLEWFKSSYSSNDGPECIEVALTSVSIRIRDSKNRQSPHLAFGAAEWAAFVSYAADH